jgi:hypothetical protein
MVTGMRTQPKAATFITQRLRPHVCPLRFYCSTREDGIKEIRKNCTG